MKKDSLTKSQSVRNSIKDVLKSSSITYEVDVNNISNMLKSNPNATIYDFQISREKLLNLILYLLRKTSRSQAEIHIITKFVATLPLFLELSKRLKFNEYNEIIYKLSSNIGYLNLNKDNLLFRNGDKGDRFYIILSGKMAVLISKEVKLEMTQQEYIKHLIKLKRCGENLLFSKTINLNKQIYPIDEENFEEFLNILVKEEYINNLNHSKSDNMIVINDSSIKRLSSKKDYVRKVTIKNTEFDDIINYQKRFFSISDESSNLVKTNVNQYLCLIKPTIYETENLKNSIKTEIITFEYHHVLTLETGECFGDIALEHVSLKRTATMISIEETNLGFITKQIYETCIKEANEKIKNSNVKFILTSRIFQGFNKHFFDKKQIFNQFVNTRLKQGDFVFKENEEPSFIYLLKSGEYHITMKKSLYEINYLIKELGGNSDEKSDKKLFDVHEFGYNKFLHKKHDIKISIIKDHGVIGLSDFNIMNKYFCSCYCLSIKGETYKLEKKFYQNLMNIEPKLIYNFKIYKALQNQILLEKLLKFKNSKILSETNVCLTDNITFRNQNTILSKKDSNNYHFITSIQFNNNNLYTDNNDNTIKKFGKHSNTTENIYQDLENTAEKPQENFIHRNIDNSLDKLNDESSNFYKYINMNKNKRKKNIIKLTNKINDIENVKEKHLYTISNKSSKSINNNSYKSSTNLNSNSNNKLPNLNVDSNNKLSTTSFPILGNEKQYYKNLTLLNNLSFSKKGNLFNVLTKNKFINANQSSNESRNTKLDNNSYCNEKFNSIKNETNLKEIRSDNKLTNISNINFTDYLYFDENKEPNTVKKSFNIIYSNAFNKSTLQKNSIQESSSLMYNKAKFIYSSNNSKKNTVYNFENPNNSKNIVFTQIKSKSSEKLSTISIVEKCKNIYKKKSEKLGKSYKILNTVI